MSVKNMSWGLLRALPRPGTRSPSCRRPHPLVGMEAAARASLRPIVSPCCRYSKAQARHTLQMLPHMQMACHSTGGDLGEAAPASRKKLVFMGTPEIAANVLKVLLNEASKPDASFEVSAVVTQPGRPTGRKRIVKPSPVETMALENGIDADCVFTPASARDEAFLAAMASLQPSLCVTAAYGNFLPKAFLAIPEFGTLNIHPSLLPKFRGAAPVQRALEAGVPVTGVSVAFTVLKMDAGPIVAQEEVNVNPNVKAPQLLEELFVIGAKLLLQHLGSVWNGEAIKSAIAQNPDEVIHTEKLTKDEGILDFSLPADALHNKVRGFAGWPGTEAYFITVDTNGNSDDLRLKVITTRVSDSSSLHNEDMQEVQFVDGAMLIACGSGTTLGVLEVQPLGKKVMKVKDFQNGLKASKKKLLKAP